MNITHIYKDYYPTVGGIENHIKALAEVQAAAGHAVTVLVTNTGPTTTTGYINGVRVVRAARLATVASTPLSVSLPRALAATRPDLTHLHFPYPVGEISQLVAGHGRPYVVTYHSDIVHPRQQAILWLYRPLLWRVLRSARRVIATSANYVASSPWLQQLAGRCQVIPLGIDAAPFTNARPLLPPAGLPTLLFVGRHRYYKRLDDLLRTLRHVPARLLVGGDGPMHQRWTRLAGELGLGARVRFLGHVAEVDLPGLYASADVFVLPSNLRAEAFGTVLLEAMAAGLPCVTTELATGTSYVVRQGVSGLVVPPRNPQALAGAINRLLGDAAWRRALGVAGQQRVLREFTRTQMAEQIDAVYNAVLEPDRSDAKRLTVRPLA